MAGNRQQRRARPLTPPQCLRAGVETRLVCCSPVRPRRRAKAGRRALPPCRWLLGAGGRTLETSGAECSWIRIPSGRVASGSPCAQPASYRLRGGIGRSPPARRPLSARSCRRRADQAALPTTLRKPPPPSEDAGVLRTQWAIRSSAPGGPGRTHRRSRAPRPHAVGASTQVWPRVVRRRTRACGALADARPRPSGIGSGPNLRSAVA